jgi:hypothetical protein
VKIPIHILNKDEAFTQMHEICADIYFYRNIVPDAKKVLEAIQRIDQLFATLEYDGDIEKEYQLMNDCAIEVSNLE